MEEHIYQKMRQVEEDHWWFRSRRRILESVIKSLKLPRDAAILDMGCGTGGNLALLSRFGSVSALELNDGAREQANARNIATVLPGSLPDNLPFPAESFDLIVLLDVLEHIEDDSAALRALKQLLRPGGRIVMTVPAFGFLWGRHDEIHHHFRRYNRSLLAQAVDRAGLRTDYAGYCNTWLFPAVAVVRLIQRLIPPRGETGLGVPPTPVNKLLEGVFSSEALLIPAWRLPFGVSLLATLTAEPHDND